MEKQIDEKHFYLADKKNGKIKNKICINLLISLYQKNDAQLLLFFILKVNNQQKKAIT